MPTTSTYSLDYFMAAMSVFVYILYSLHVMKQLRKLTCAQVPSIGGDNTYMNSREFRDARFWDAIDLEIGELQLH